METLEVDSVSAPIEPPKVEVEGSGPLSPREAARALAAWRYKRSAAAAQAESAAKPPAAAADAKTDAQADADSASAANEQPVSAAPADAQPSGDKSENDEPDTAPPIDPPHSWSKDARERWQTLPRDLQEYIAQREQERDRELRRGQNEAAERLKTLSAKEQALEQARQQYEQALPVLLQTLQAQQQGEFSDIKTMADVEKLSREDPFRYLQWTAHQQKIAAVQAELKAAEERQLKQLEENWTKFAEAEDRAFLEKAPEFADKDKATKLAQEAFNHLRDLGFSDEEVRQLWNGQRALTLRDHRVQLLVRDAVALKQARQNATQKPSKPVPPVQRPGSGRPQGSDLAKQIRELENRLSQSTGLAAARLAAELISLKRQAGANQ
jgi:hypothetical protein